MKRLVYALLAIVLLDSTISLSARTRKMGELAIEEKASQEQPGSVQLEDQYIASLDAMGSLMRSIDVLSDDDVFQRPQMMSEEEFAGMMPAVASAISAIATVYTYTVHRNGSLYVREEDMQEARQSLTTALRSYYGALWLVSLYAQAAHDTAFLSGDAADDAQAELGAELTASAEAIREQVLALAAWNDAALDSELTAVVPSVASEHNDIVPEWDE